MRKIQDHFYQIAFQENNHKCFEEIISFCDLAGELKCEGGDGEGVGGEEVNWVRWLH